MAPTLPGEGAVEGGTAGALVMDGGAGVPPPNSQSLGPPRNPPAGSPSLPQPPGGPGFPQYRGIIPPFVSFSPVFWFKFRQCFSINFYIFFNLLLFYHVSAVHLQGSYIYLVCK